MRLGIDARFAVGTIRDGLFVHHYNLLRALRGTGDISTTLFLNGWTIQPFTREREATVVRELSDAFNGLATKVVRMPGKLQQLRLRMSLLGWMDVFYHVYGGTMDNVPTAANAYLVPDIIPLVVDYPVAGFRERAQAYYARAVEQGDIIFVYSEHTKRDVIEHCGATDGQIMVMPLAPAPEFCPRKDPAVLAEYLQSLGLGSQPYILTVGTLQPRKNLVTLIRAFARLKRLAPALPHKLVLSGSKWIGFEPVFDAIAAEGLHDQVVYLGHAERLDLLYNGTSLFVFPSIYEGFGLPPLEAMACGVPVVASNATSIPEVVGDAGLLFNPLDEIELCEVMRRVLEDKSLHEKLSEAGLQRAGQFSWHKTARLFAAGLSQAVENRRASRR